MFLQRESAFCHTGAFSTPLNATWSDALCPVIQLIQQKMLSFLLSKDKSACFFKVLLQHQQCSFLPLIQLSLWVSFCLLSDLGLVDPNVTLLEYSYVEWQWVLGCLCVFLILLNGWNKKQHSLNGQCCVKCSSYEVQHWLKHCEVLTKTPCWDDFLNTEFQKE